MIKLFSLAVLLAVAAQLKGCGTLAATGAQQQPDRFGFGQPSTPASDASISAEIRNRLIKDGDVPANQIEIEIHAGVVVLSGQVSNNSVARRVVEICRKTPGVKQVDSRLRVSSP